MYFVSEKIELYYIKTTLLRSGLRNLTGVKVLYNSTLTPKPFKGAGHKTDG